jgi:hypothetical protein
MKHNHLFIKQQLTRTSTHLKIVSEHWRWHGDVEAIQHHGNMANDKIVFKSFPSIFELTLAAIYKAFTVPIIGNREIWLTKLAGVDVQNVAGSRIIIFLTKISSPTGLLKVILAHSHATMAGRVEEEHPRA